MAKTEAKQTIAETTKFQLEQLRKFWSKHKQTEALGESDEIAVAFLTGKYKIDDIDQAVQMEYFSIKHLVEKE